MTKTRRRRLKLFALIHCWRIRTMWLCISRSVMSFTESGDGKHYTDRENVELFLLLLLLVLLSSCLFSAPFASLTKTAKSNEHSRSSPNYRPPYSLSHTYVLSLSLCVCLSLTLSLSLSLSLLLASAADKRIDERKRKEKVDSHSLSSHETNNASQSERCPLCHSYAWW